MHEAHPDKLLHMFETDVHELVWKWIVYTPKFSDDASKVSYLGLLGLLRATLLDMKLASVKIKKGGEYAQNDDVVLLQTKLVHAFSEFLEYSVKKEEQDQVLKGNKGFGGDDMDDYGGDYGDYGDDDYGDDGFDAALNSAQNDFGFDVDNFGNNNGELDQADDSNKEEERLIGHLVSPPAHSDLSKRDYIASLIKAQLRKVGASTLKMIIGSE